MDMPSDQLYDANALSQNKYSIPNTNTLEPFNVTSRLLNELPQSRDEKINKDHVRSLFDIFADEANHPLIDFDIKYSGLDADSEYAQVLNLSQKNKISQTIRRIIEFLYESQGQEILKDLDLQQENISLNQIKQVSEDTITQLESVIKNINQETIAKIKKTAINLSKEINNKINSDAVEEAAWYEAYIEVADDQEKYDLLKIQLDIEKAQNTNNSSQVSALKELFLNTIRFGIYNNNKQMGLKSIAIGAKTSDNNISPFSFKPAQPSSPSDVSDFTFSKATGGLPDVVLMKPEGGVYFSYANHFANGSMESDQLERHSALLMEADHRFRNNDPHKFNNFHEAFQLVKTQHGGKNNERALYNSMTKNKDKYIDVAGQFTVSSYQNIGEFTALSELVERFYSNLKPNQLEEKIKHISQLIQTLPLLGQDLYNNKIKEGDYFEQQWGEIASCQVNSMFVKEKSHRGDNEKSIKNILSNSTSKITDAVKSIFTWSENESDKLTINSYTKGIKNNKTTLSDNDIKLNTELLKKHDDLNLILAFTATAKQSLRMSILEGIFKVLSDTTDTDIRRHIPKAIDEYKEISDTLRLEDDAFLEQVVGKFIAENEANEAKVEANEAKVEANEAKAELASKIEEDILYAIKYDEIEQQLERDRIRLTDLESYIRNEIQKLEDKGMSPEYPDIILSQVAIDRLNVYLSSQKPKTDEVNGLMQTIDVYSNITKKQTQSQSTINNSGLTQG